MRYGGVCVYVCVWHSRDCSRPAAFYPHMCHMASTDSTIPQKLDSARAKQTYLFMLM